MGTRSLTKFYSDKKSKKPFVTMYVQFDGYPSGVGAKLAAFLAEHHRVNGIAGWAPHAEIANGIDCMAALTVSHFKGDEPGDVYLTENVGGHGEEYAYEVRPSETDAGDWHVTVKETDWRTGRARKTLYTGTPKGLLTWIEQQSEK